jgi:hypothetical protein
VYSHRFLSVENRSFSIKWCGGLFYVDLCVFVFLISCDICVGLCVIGSDLLLRGFDMCFLFQERKKAYSHPIVPNLGR